MRNDDGSYERYKQYRRNKYRYEQEQIMFPIAIIVGGAILISLWKYILIAIAAILVLAVVVAILYLYLKKQLKSQQDIVLSKEDAKEGVEAIINVPTILKRYPLFSTFRPVLRTVSNSLLKTFYSRIKKARKYRS